MVKTMYKVLTSFIDGVENRAYKAGDTFIVGPSTDKQRIEDLKSAKNNLQQPLIEEVILPKVKQEVKGE